MLEKNDLENLANLARLLIPEEEKETLRKEVDSILGFVGEIKKLTPSSPVKEARIFRASLPMRSLPRRRRRRMATFGSRKFCEIFLTRNFQYSILQFSIS